MRKPIFKTWWFWVAVVAIVGIIGMFTNNDESPTPPEPTVAADTTQTEDQATNDTANVADKSATNTPEETVKEPEKEEPAFDWKTAEVNEENIKKALTDNVGAAMAIPLSEKTFRKFVSSMDTKGTYVEITVNPGLFGDEKDFVKKAGGSLIAYSKVLFQNPDVYEVSVVANIDNVGGGENQGVYISWRRNQAEGVDYDKVLDDMFGDITIPYQMARKYSIQKELFEGLTDFDLPQNNNL